MLFTWKAIYSDGTYLTEIEGNGTKHKYPEIDRSKLKEFSLLDEEGTVKVNLAVLPGQKLIYRKRRLSHNEGGRLVVYGTIHLMGFHENRNGTNVQMLAFIFPDGRVELMDRFRTDHPYYVEIEHPLEVEK